MTTGRDTDLENTRRAHRREIPIEPEQGMSWLGHTKEAGVIDLMILDEHYTMQEIAEAISDLSPNNCGDIDKLIKRVKSHIAHLQTTWNGKMRPHGLVVRHNAEGCLSFNLG